MTFTVVRHSVALASIRHALDILVIRHYETWRKLGEINVSRVSAIQILVQTVLVVIAFQQILVAHIIITKIVKILKMMNI